MFEKEGIKYAIEETVGTECLSMPIEDFHFIDLAESQQEKAQCFKDGAEFGYNKAKAEMQEQGLALQSDMDKTIEQNIALKKELNKANEWHYPSKGEYPKENKRYLCKLKVFVGSGICYECFDYDTEYYTWKNACGEVIAWCEIPKYTEE